ncbi:MAG TPA: hypothetical protein VE907_19565 [Gammaproteobacteria bacterium]|nr:hypothetical protein [Gammaproteobacteria bacterium]
MKQKKLLAVTPQAPPPEPAPAEHIYIATDDSNPDPQIAAVTVRSRVQLRNTLRRTSTELTIYEEGFLKVVPAVGGKRGDAFRLDLHFLDPVPTIKRVVAKRTFYTAFAGVAAMGLAALMAQVDFLRLFASATFFGFAAVAAGALLLGVCRSYEKIEFVTLHGRAQVLGLVASLGSMKRFHAFVPQLCRAIEESAERIDRDPSAYLRAEMREHYRLRRDGVLGDEECAESTGRILSQFDIQL